MNILKLLNNNKWDEIYDLIKKNKINLFENNIVYLAAYNNNHDIILYLLKNTPELLETKNTDGNTAIHILAMSGYLNLLKKCLIKNNDFINLVNNRNETILHILFNDNDFLEWCVKNIKKIDFDILDNNGTTVLMKNIDTNNIKNIKLLIKNNININYPESFTPLYYALDKNNSNIALLLIENNANVSLKTYKYFTTLMEAVYRNMYEVVDKILQKDITLLNYRGAESDINLILLCIKNNNYDILNLLLNYNYDLDIQDKYLDTTLHTIFMNNIQLPPDIIAKLLYFGDLTIRNLENSTPLHFSYKNIIGKIIHNY